MISLEVFLVGLGSIMLVLGYLTAKIMNIEELNIKLYEQLKPPKFHIGSYVQYIYGGGIYVIKDWHFDKSTRRYTYDIVNTKTYNSYNDIEEQLLTIYYDKPKEDKEANEDDVS